MEDDAACMLVLIGATPDGKKELAGFHVGVRESAQSWRELLVDLKGAGPRNRARDRGRRRGARVLEGTRGDLSVHAPPALKASQGGQCPEQGAEVGPALDEDRSRRYPRRPDKASAEAAVAVFIEKYAAKYPEAAGCLTKDTDALLAFFDFPAEHWDHLRTPNPIESVFETVRHRTVRTKGALASHGTPHGLQARHGGIKDLAAAEGQKLLAPGHRRRQVHQRRRRDRERRSARCLAGPVTQNRP
jgi:hypothetical protein